ncbi:MAG: cell division protein FtsA [Treponema sp.]|nr:MAG: cell division protein FtsA [Treponema sp.]
MSNILVGLDIGSTNIRVVAAEVLESGELQIIGVGVAPSTGLRRGSVINIEKTVEGINSAVESAEMMSGVEIFECSVGIGGNHIEGFNSRGVYPVSDKGNGNKEIDHTDIKFVIDSAKAVVIPMDREVIHVIPQTYTVDRQTGIKDPTNMIGVRLEAEVHIITGSGTSVQNIIKCANRANLQVSRFMHQGLASVKSIMTSDEANMGSVLIDIGSGTTDVVAMLDGAPVMTFSLPIGGYQVTNDLSVVKNIPFEAAEEVKISNGCCWMELLDSQEAVLLAGVGGRPPIQLSKKEICEIIQMRIQEIFLIIKDRISGVFKNQNITGSIILCGGGSLLPGITELAGSVFNTSSVRLGIPGMLGGLTGEYRNPQFSVVLGLLLDLHENNNNTIKETYYHKDNNKTDSFGKKVKSFWNNLF